MRERSWRARVARMLRDEMECQPERAWYLSFADDTGFLGAVIVKAHGITDAMFKTQHLGINPGGEIAAIPIPEDHIPADKYFNRLLSKQEIDELT
jgi:hypothetical protein